MFGVVIWFGVLFSIPCILCSIFLYPRLKSFNIIKTIKPLLYFMQSFSIYCILSLLYLLAAAITSINVDDLSFIFIFFGALLYFFARRFLNTPQNLLLFIVPEIIISAVHLLYWIRYVSIYGMSGSAGWIGYSLNAIPFGAAFSNLLTNQHWGYLHILTIILPAACAFLGGGISDYYNEKNKSRNISVKR